MKHDELLFELREAADYYSTARDPILRQQSDLCKRAADALSSVPEGGPTLGDWKSFAREVIRGTQPEDYGKWPSYYQRVMSEAVHLLERCALSEPQEGQGK